MAAAVELAARRHPGHSLRGLAQLWAAARARVELDGIALDNGQHILIGAYRETLRLMRLVGADPRCAC